MKGVSIGVRIFANKHGVSFSMKLELTITHESQSSQKKNHALNSSDMKEVSEKKKSNESQLEAI